MSRSGYSDDCEMWDLIRWRGAVAAGIRGKRGQAFLLEMHKAMQALPEPKLTADALEADGMVCAIGSVGKARGYDMSQLDPDDREHVAKVFGIPYAMACEIMYENDEGGWPHNEPADRRFMRMKKWIEEHLLPVPVDTP